MKIDLVSLFPNVFEEYIKTSIFKRATIKKLVEINLIDLRNYSIDKGKRVDSPPVSGGAGLIIKIDVIDRCLKDLKKNGSYVIITDPRGRKLTQEVAKELATKQHIIIVSGHYEGIDFRAIDYFDDIISIGDYILTGGELPSLVITDAITRLLPNVITKESLTNESFENGLLEYPQYTLPRIYDGKEIPAILFTGNHELIAEYNFYQAYQYTKEHNADLFSKYVLDEKHAKIIKKIEKLLSNQ